MDTIGERIKYVRKKLGHTQETFAEKARLKRNSLVLIETGKRNPSDRTLQDLCLAWEINFYFLKEGIGEPFLKYPSTLIQELVEEYDLDDTDKSILEAYIELAPGQREKIRGMLKDMIELIKEH